MNNPDKMGHNFYKCNSNECAFFLWDDEPLPGTMANVSLRRSRLTFRCEIYSQLWPPLFKCPKERKEGIKGCQFWLWGDEEMPSSEWRQCHCRVPALLRTMRNEKPWNTGWRFYVCAYSRIGNDGCGFWVWEDGIGPLSLSALERHSAWMEPQFKHLYYEEEYDEEYESEYENEEEKEEEEMKRRMKMRTRTRMMK